MQALGNHAINAGDRDKTQTIEEMVRLCHELLVLEVSGDYPVEAFTTLGGLLFLEFRSTLQGRTLDQVVECLREAVRMCPPGIHVIHLELVTALQFRFLQTHSDGDYHEAMGVLEEMVAPDRLGDHPSPLAVEACVLMARFTIARCDQQEGPEYIEEALSRCQSWLLYRFPGVEGYHVLIQLWKWCLGRRSDRFVGTAPGEKDDTKVIYTPARFLRHPITSTPFLFVQFNNAEGRASRIRVGDPSRMHEVRTPEEMYHMWARAWAVASTRARRAAETGDIKDIESAIKSQRSTLQLALDLPPGVEAEASNGGSLGQLLRQAFDCAGRVEHLEESISLDRHALKITATNPSSHIVTHRLSKSLIDYWQLRGRMQDLDESMRLCHVTIDDESVSAPRRLAWACEWASRARDTGHSTVSTAYRAVMSLIQYSLVFTPTRETQHAFRFKGGIFPNAIGVRVGSDSHR